MAAQLSVTTSGFGVQDKVHMYGHEWGVSCINRYDEL